MEHSRCDARSPPISPKCSKVPSIGNLIRFRDLNIYLINIVVLVFSEDLIITTGASHGLHILLSTMLDFEGFVFVDEYTYMIALDSIKHFSTVTIVPVKLNDDGVDLKDLEEKVSKRRFQSKKKEFWGIYYTIPTYHNPTGILFSPGRFQSFYTYVLLNYFHNFMYDFYRGLSWNCATC